MSIELAIKYLHYLTETYAGMFSEHILSIKPNGEFIIEADNRIIFSGPISDLVERINQWDRYADKDILKVINSK